MSNSLAVRIAYAGMIVGGSALFITAILLVVVFRIHIEQHVDDLIFDHIEELVAESKITDEGKLQLDWFPLDPRFHQHGSGWYWEISQAENVLMKSRSLGDKSLEIIPEKRVRGLKGIKKNRLVLADLKERGSLQMQQFSGPEGMRLRGLLLEISFPKLTGPLLYVVTSPVSEIEHDVKDFIYQVMTAFFVLFFGLIIAVYTQVRVAMKPLRSMKRSINEVHQGKTNKLPEDFPTEVQIVVDELNSLLAHNDDLLARARTNIGNLAHAVKNPLTVIRNEAKKVDGNSGILIQDQATMIVGNMDRHLAHARAAASANILGSRTNVKEIVEDLVFYMEQLYQAKQIKFHAFDLDDCWFSGEGEDLEEMVGNLMDNACKWTRDQVWVHVEKEENRLTLKIEDNGPGIPEKNRIEVLQRGLKLDETVPGHGLGLSIVHDIAELYKGSLTLQASVYGGLCAILELPAAKGNSSEKHLPVKQRAK